MKRGTRRRARRGGEVGIVVRVRSRVLAVALATVVLALPAAPALAQDRRDIRDQHLFRLEFDNDTFFASDDAFSAGWSLQLHSPLLDSWEGTFPGWVGHLPGLGDDGEGGRIVRWSAGLSQVIVTPHDITIAEPQPEDSPWAGILGLHGALSSNDNRRLAAVQLYLGCMGPCSQAEDVQRFVHEDLHRGESPAGWSNQLDTQILGNLNLSWSRKLLVPDDSAYAHGRWARDVAIGGQVGVGNLATYARAQIEYRFGLSVPMGFTHVPDPPGIGIALDPVYALPDASPGESCGWRSYASVVVRTTYFEHLAPAEGGRTENGGFHPGVDANQGQPEVLIGLHVGRAPAALHLTYYRYLFGRQEIGTASSLDWMNLSLEMRF